MIKNTQKTFMLLTMAVISMAISVPTVFAEEVTVSLPPGTSVPGCEETNECYIPFSVTVHPKDKVIWSNDDSAAHTVTSGTPADGPDGNFDSSLFMAGTTFSHTFDTLGEYPYFCMVHPWMEGSVIVTVGGGMEKDLGTITLGSAVQSPSSTMISSSSSMKVSNTDLMIGYEITTGKVVSVMPDVDSNSLVVGINTSNAGTITLELPRSVLDAKMSDSDDEFFVLVDGEEVTFEESVTETKRTLTVSFPAGTEEIEVIGTFVIPEFGTIAAMILAVAIISIIAASARSRLSIMPRI
ncbi:MAG: PEFG-CTERM sorting domain-containing protein [Nitrosopumilus sp.]|nr:PEFG-CTERM sorting domain-containing protein [Nitrosopumilus sp.]